MEKKLIEQQEQIKAMQENEDSAIKVMKMYEECKRRIDKAIEYIEEQTVDVEMNIYGMPPTIKSFRGNTERLLEILKGEYKYE